MIMVTDLLIIDHLISVSVFTILGKNFSRQHFDLYFSYFSLKIGFEIICKIVYDSRDNLHEMSNTIFWVKQMSSICHLLNLPRAC